MDEVKLRSSNALGPMPAAARMRTVDEMMVHARLAVIFEIAADVERWPKWLPHYKYVRMRERYAGGGIVEMAARRPFLGGLIKWPASWVALMEVQHQVAGGVARPAIRFRHIEGITKGMEVEWSFESVTKATRVSVLHLWNGPGWPVIGPIAAQGVIGPIFVHGIASRTLAGLAREAEGRLTSSSPTLI